MHTVIAVTMAITMLGFGYTYRALKNRVSITGNLVITGVVGAVLNGPVSLSFSICTMAIMAGMEAALGLLALLPILVLASVANIVLCAVIFRALDNVWSRIV